MAVRSERSLDVPSQRSMLRGDLLFVLGLLVLQLQYSDVVSARLFTVLQLCICSAMLIYLAPKLMFQFVPFALAAAGAFSILVGLLAILHYGDGGGFGAAILMSVRSFVSFAAPLHIASRYGHACLIHALTSVVGIALLFTDVFILATSGRGIVRALDEWGTATSFYLIGDKFSVAYMHMFLFGLVANSFGRRKRSLVVLSAGMVACILVDCSTGLVGLGSMLVVVAAFRIAGASRIPAGVVPGVVLIAGFVAVHFDTLVRRRSIGGVLDTVFGRSPTITGRTEIWSHLWDLTSVAPFFGFGSIARGAESVRVATGGVNAQQGLFELALAFGWVGAGIFVLLCIFALHSSLGGRGEGVLASPSIGIGAFLVAMSVCSLVEISLSTALFFLALGVVCALDHAVPRNRTLLVEQGLGIGVPGLLSGGSSGVWGRSR